MTPVLNTLVRMKADLATKDKDGNTLLHYSARLDSYDVCKILLGAKVDPAVANRDGQVPRQLISATNRDLVELLDGAGYVFALTVSHPTRLASSNCQCDGYWCDVHVVSSI